ncbi:MAG TPA: hypothetical protein ENN25_02160 [Euryarchaeota archaeon]|nr:hypothetical protein [Euryarchaeota archaeon]
MRKLVAVISAFILGLFITASALTSAINVDEEDVISQNDPVQAGLDLNSTAYEWMHQWMGDANTTAPMDYNYSYGNSWNQGGSCDTVSTNCNSTPLAP